MGLPTVSMGLLGLMMTPLQAATLLVVPTLLSNIWQLATGPDVRGLVARLNTAMIAMAAGTPLGVAFLTSTSPLVPMALGGVLVLYGVVGLITPHFAVPPNHERWASPLIGLLSGIINGATGISAMPLVPYLNSLKLSRDELIQALGLMFTVSIVALTLCLVWTGDLHVQVVGASTLALIPVFIGMWAGQAIRRRLHADTFRSWFFIGLIALGGYMAIRAAAQLV